MQRDSKLMRGDGPTVFTSVKLGEGVDDVDLVQRLCQHGVEDTVADVHRVLPVIRGQGNDRGGRIDVASGLDHLGRILATHCKDKKRSDIN